MPAIKDEFEQASQEERPSIFGEFVGFLKENRNWWLVPILLVLAAVAGLVLLSGSGVAPFIYTMF